MAETMMYAYKSQNNVEIRVARIFNTFGEAFSPSVIFSFIARIYSRETHLGENLM